MVNLIGNEIKKVFSKLGVKIIILIAIVVMIIAVVVDRFVVDKLDNYFEMPLDEQISMYEEELKYIDQSENLSLYLDCKTNIEMLQLVKKYAKNNDWRTECIYNNAYDYIYAINMLKYGEKTNNDELINAEKEYETFLTMLENDDWREYTKACLQIAQEKLEQSKTMLQNASISQRSEMEQTVSINELEVETLEYRLKNDVPYDNSYLDQAIDTYRSSMTEVILNENNDNFLGNDVKAEGMIAKHVLDTKKDLYNYDNAASLYKDYMTTTNGMFLTIIIIVVSGAIISDEFNKGTIKQLLIRPYSRAKIWFSKYLTAIIVLIISMIIISIFAVIIFGIFYGFNGYFKYEIGVYDFNTGSAYSMNVFIYVAMILISKLPYYIMLSTIAMFVGTMINNTAMAVAVPLLGTAAASIVNVLLSSYEKFRFLKFFITPNWDWSVYNFGRPSEFDFIDFKFSIIIYMVYLVLGIGLSILRFKKEDIKNI